MKKLIVILGPNGVGKSTTAKAFLEKNTFHFYDNLDCPAITTTDLSPEEVAGRIAEMIE